jgi:hypothetical protein
MWVIMVPVEATRCKGLPIRMPGAVLKSTSTQSGTTGDARRSFKAVAELSSAHHDSLENLFAVREYELS